MKLNLNADVGESFGAWTMGNDAALMPIVNSASIACGFHAGDPKIMRATVRAALAGGASLGAHPSYPDLAGFGRRPMAMAPVDLEAAILYQLGALAGIARAEGGVLTHVKPHGALYAGADGLDAVRVLAAGAGEWLRPGGWLVLEIGAGQRAEVAALLQAAGLVDVEVRVDLAGRDRIALGRRP